MKLCIPIRCTSMDQALKLIQVAQQKSDLLEIWLDSISDLDIQTLIGHKKSEFIAVCKSESENGLFRGSEHDKITILKKAVSHGFEYIDLSLDTNKNLCKDLKNYCKSHFSKLIVSFHDFGKTHSLRYLFSLYRKAVHRGADIVKIAVKINSYENNVVLFNLIMKTKKRKIPIIVIGMGTFGKFSRIFCPMLGSLWNYAPLSKDGSTAEGQMTVEEWKGLGEKLKIKN